MPLTREELETPRSAADMLPWVLAACQRFNTKQLRADARLGRHLARELMHEALPMARFAHRFFDASPDVTITHILGNQNFDAVVDDRRAASSDLRFLEVTTTVMNYEESLRMELLNRDGHAPAFGPVTAQGPRHARTGIHASGIAHEASAIVREHLARVEEVVLKKAGKDYPPGTALIVAIDEFPALAEPKAVDALDALSHIRLLPALDGTRFCLLALQGGGQLHMTYRR